jgi:two-component system sensor histidine kinase QseC
MMLSIRMRLLLWMTGGMAILLIVFAMVVYGMLSRSLRNSFDEVLLASARTIGGAVERDGAKVKFDMDEREAPEFYRLARPDYFQLWFESGEDLALSPSLGTRNLDRFSALRDSPIYRPLRLPDGRAGRAVGLLFTPKADEDTKGSIPVQRVVLVVARETAPLDSSIRQIRIFLAAAAAGTLLLTVLVAAVVVRRGLKPLDALAARIAAVRQEELSAPIPAEGIPVEIAPVVRRLNDLLSRLDDAFQRERGFTSDAAHELRTPLAGMRCTLELALSQPRAGSDYCQAITECLEVVRQMQGIVESLLTLARFESGQATVRPETIDVRELIETGWQPWAGMASSRSITFESRLPPNLACIADRGAARMIVAALLANAAEYTDDRGRIEVAGLTAGKFVSLTVANTGCSLAEEDVRHVFERFWRGDPARAGTEFHCGLGLALVQRAMANLGGSVSARIAGGIFTITLTLPATTAQL